jgi:hypothetical protein
MSSDAAVDVARNIQSKLWQLVDIKKVAQYHIQHYYETLDLNRPGLDAFYVRGFYFRLITGLMRTQMTNGQSTRNDMIAIGRNQIIERLQVNSSHQSACFYADKCVL